MSELGKAGERLPIDMNPYHMPKPEMFSKKSKGQD